MPTLFIISGPSAVGKDSLIDSLMDFDDNIVRGRKITTRKPRPGERKTSSYLYLTHEQFHKRLSEKKLFHDYVKNEIWYAIDKEFIMDEINSGYDVFLVYSKYDKVADLKKDMIKEGVNVKTVLLLSTFSDLKERINKRYPHSSEEISTRLETMKKDLRFLLSQKTLTEYDSILQNMNSEEGIDHLLQKIKEILDIERSNLIGNEHALNQILGTYEEKEKTS